MNFRIEYKGQAIEIDGADKVKIVADGGTKWIEASAMLVAPSLVDAIATLRADLAQAEANLQAQIDQANEDADLMAVLIKCIFSKSAFERLKNGHMKMSYFGQPNYDEVELCYNQLLKIERLKTLRQL